MKRNLLSVFVALCIAVGVVSCSASTEDVKPDNVISSSSGLKIALEWTTGSSTTQAKEDADLTLTLKKGVEEIRSSDGYGFENILLESVFADGEYKLFTGAYSVSKKADYTLYVTDGDGENVKTYTGYFNAGDSDMEAEFLKIKKSGNTYTLTEL